MTTQLDTEQQPAAHARVNREEGRSSTDLEVSLDPIGFVECTRIGRTLHVHQLDMKYQAGVPMLHSDMRLEGTGWSLPWLHSYCTRIDVATDGFAELKSS